MPVLSLHTIVQEVEDQALLPNSLVQRERKLEILQLLLSGCEQPLKQIVNFVATHGSLAQANKKLKDKLTFGLEDLHDARSKITLHTSAISVFLTTLSNASLERIERKLEKLFKAVSAGTRESSVLSLANEPATGTDTEQQWDMFRTEMMTEGIPRDELDDNKSFVQVKINDLMRSTPSLPAAQTPQVHQFTARRVKALADDAPDRSAERSRKPRSSAFTLKVVVKDERAYTALRTSIDVGIRLKKRERKAILREYERQDAATRARSLDMYQRGLSPDLMDRIMDQGIFATFAVSALESAKIDAGIRSLLRSEDGSCEDLATIERDIFHEMESLEDLFEELHIKAEILRQQCRLRFRSAATLAESDNTSLEFYTRVRLRQIGPGLQVSLAPRYQLKMKDGWRGAKEPDGGHPSVTDRFSY